jgi:hypothetical protein
LTLAVGPSNGFSPGPADRGQPRTFQRGTRRSNIAALGLGPHFSVVVLTDEQGRSHRKPHPRPFRLALTALGAPPGHVVYVGDRPDKDVAGAVGVDMRAIRVGPASGTRRPTTRGPRRCTRCWTPSPPSSGSWPSRHTSSSGPVDRPRSPGA